MLMPRRLLIAGIVVAAGVAAALAHAPTRQQIAVAVGLAQAEPVPAGPPIGALDRPVTEAVFSTTLKASGWALDRRGIESVVVNIAGKALDADYGMPRTDVAGVHPDYPHAGRAGFVIDRSLAALRPLRFPFDVVATNAGGMSTTLGRRSLIPPSAMRLWEPWADDGRNAFHFLMATSGVAKGGAGEIDRHYEGYASGSQRVGVAVPILYMRTTRGRAGDWVFDPAFDTTRKCGERVLADDALDDVLRHAAQVELPVQFILNGGIWADSVCNVPDWDLNDHLEETPANNQWTQDDRVYPDDHLKNLAGSTASPELARSLTLNVYAQDVRRYKKRNLQAAARAIAAFAKQHPHLVVGINLDSDTYMNPFFEQREWFDYNPGTLRQFREWLRGEGPYAGRGGEGIPDLRAFRRARPWSLAEVNRLANAQWKRWDEVDPPRRFPGSEHRPLASGETPVWDDSWYREWDTFRKHLVALHYDELAQWAHEAGIARDRIFTAQGFVAPEGSSKPFAVKITDSGQNYDSGGVSIEGAIPRNGHLGAILYGAAAENRVRMAHRHGLFATFARMDPGWAVVEANLADLKRPAQVPTYVQAYRAFRDLFNFDARQVSLMAWNGSNGIYAGQPGYVAYTSWRNTPAEEAMRDHLVSHAGLPLGSRLWTFGSVQHGDDDGWSVEGATAHAERARLVVEPGSRRVTLLSPPDQVIRRNNARQLVIGIDRRQVTRIEVWARTAPDAAWTRLSDAFNVSGLEDKPAGLAVPLRWPSSWRDDAIAEQVRVVLMLPRQDRPLNVDRIALIGAKPPTGSP